MPRAAKKRYNFRFDEAFVGRIDQWASQREHFTGIPTSRTEAIRLLISKGLQSQPGAGDDVKQNQEAY